MNETGWDGTSDVKTFFYLGNDVPPVATQHLIWVLSRPEIYISFVPALTVLGYAAWRLWRSGRLGPVLVAAALAIMAAGVKVRFDGFVNLEPTTERNNFDSVVVAASSAIVLLAFVTAGIALARGAFSPNGTDGRKLLCIAGLAALAAAIALQVLL